MAHKQEIQSAMQRVLDSGWYILGKEVEGFEHEFAAWLGVPHAVGVANGTDAIELALRAAGIGHGDLVATVSHTAVATVAAIRRCGAEPRFVDVDDCFTMDPDSLTDVLNACPDIKAVVVVHLYGQMADMPPILEIAAGHGLVIIEDCAQAHGAALDGQKAGTWGDFGCFSFYPTKNLGALGDGGTVVTNDADAAGRLKMLRQYGWDDARVSRMDGVNSRLDEVQAAILRVRLPHLDADNAARQRIADRYRAGLETIVLPVKRENGSHVYHQFVTQSACRDTLLERLKLKGVQCGVHYPLPVHLQPAYDRQDCQPVSLENTEAVVHRILSLPMYPQMTEQDAETVIGEVASCLRQ